MEKHINEMTLQDFQKIEFRMSYNEAIGIFDSLIIMPREDLHESGYRKMDFIAVKDNKPTCKLGGCSDVIQMYVWAEMHPPLWSIDCLPKSGLLRVFSAGNKIKAGADLSSFELYSVENK